MLERNSRCALWLISWLGAAMCAAHAAPTCMPDTMSNYESQGTCQMGDANVTITLSNFYFTAKNVSGSEALVQDNQVLVTPSFVDAGTYQYVNLNFTTTNGGTFQAIGTDENSYTFNYLVDPPPPMILGQGLTDLPTDPGEVFLKAQLCLGAPNDPDAAGSGSFNCPTNNEIDLMTNSMSPPAMATFSPVSELGVFITADLQGQGSYAYLYGIGSDSQAQPSASAVPEPGYLGAVGLAAAAIAAGRWKFRRGLAG